jgi:NADH-quinone oxidoreductase subunit L
VILSLGTAAVFWLDRKELSGLKGLTERNSAAGAGHRFLLNKYYLDHLYEGTIVASIRGPFARAAYWVNQHVIDGVVNTAGKSSAALGRLVYRYVDQDVVDGAVNGIANETGQAGGLMTYIQTGRVQRYALILFGSVGLLALLLVIFS